MSHEEHLIQLARDGNAGFPKCSTSEQITVALALGLLAELPREFATVRIAWLRLNLRQRAIVSRHNPKASMQGERYLASLTKKLGHPPLNYHGR